MHRKVGLALALAAAVVLMACDWAIPEKASVQASPKFELPLGIKLNISDYLDMDNILGDLSGSVPGVKIYKYENTSIALGAPLANINGATDVQTYLMRYPIANMPLDLGTSVPEQIDLGTVPVPSIPAAATSALTGKAIYATNDGLYIAESDWTGLSTPVQTVLTGAGFKHAVVTAIPPMTIIDLENEVELGKWMKNILLASGVGITIEGDRSAAIELAVPALGVGTKVPTDNGATTYEAGIYNSFTNKTSYTDTDGSYTTLLPSSGASVDNTNLKVYVRIINPTLLTGNLHLGLNFSWATAQVSPGTAGKLEDEFPLPDMKSLIEMLGGLKFAALPAYLYVDGMPGQNATMTLSAEVAADPLVDPPAYHYFLSGGASGASILMDKSPTLTSTDISGTGDIKTYTGVIPTYSASFDMKGLLNGDYTGNLKYSVDVGTINLTNTGSADPRSIIADLLLVLPVYFAVDLTATDDDTLAKVETDYTPFEGLGPLGENLIKVPLSMLNSISTGDDLLAGVRDTLGESRITELSLYLDITKNDIFDDLSLGINNGGSWRVLNLSDTSPATSFTINEGQIYPALNLSIVVLMPESDDIAQTGTLALKPLRAKAGINIDIKASVTANIDAQIEF
ncbi:hypothetical protein FACS189483_00150 [Spirochaetia bacterium]|nr:hypothetical protein FACS189483_00150 [Spirochaetia bacterium]